MDLNKSINSLYSHEIINDLIKNEVTIYGKFLRKILFDNCSIDDYFKDNNKINGYTRLVFRDIVERDLDKFIKKINNHPNIHTTSRCEFVTYILEYNKSLIQFDMSYIKSNISYYLSYYRAELDITLDIDTIYIDRTGLGSLNINNLYSTAPSPFYKIINNINNKKFKILSKNNLLINQECYNEIITLKKQGWTNIDNEITKIDIVKDNERFNEECGICGDTHNTTSIKLPCNHYYHNKCFEGYINNYILQKEYLDKELNCPYCTNNLNILNVI